MKKSMGSRIFDGFNILFMLFIIFITAYPVYYVVVASFSDSAALSRHTGALWAPLQPYTLNAYKMVFKDALIVSGFLNTLFILCAGLVLQMVMTTLGAYFLTLKGPMLKTPIIIMIIFTMYFSGGLVPAYLNIKDLGLMDSRWALIIPAAVGTSNMIILKSGFQSIPDSLTESATLDGATHRQIITKIMVPLSKATLAVLVLYYAVGHWNSWFSASIYLRSADKYPLQLVVRNLLKATASTIMEGVSVDEAAQAAELIKYALIVVTTAPIMVVYPFLQKYFVKGVMIGAIKG